MVTCSVLVSKGEVFKELELFLQNHNYKNIVADHDQYIISAQRKDSFFSKKYSVMFFVKPKSVSVTEIEITVNPQHAMSTKSDVEKESKIRSRVYFYF